MKKKIKALVNKHVGSAVIKMFQNEFFCLMLIVAILLILMIWPELTWSGRWHMFIAMSLTGGPFAVVFYFENYDFDRIEEKKQNGQPLSILDKIALLK